MKRAEVWSIDGHWIVGIDHQPHRHVFMRWRPISDRLYALPTQTEHPTHAEALAHALHEVGLTPTNPEKEQA